MVKNQPQAVTLANPFRIPLHRKGKVKKIRVKDSVCIGDIREFFLTFVLWPKAHRTIYCKSNLEFRVILASLRLRVNEFRIRM